ncbi:TIGR00645 family protein, partial [Burkholderia mallei]
MPRRCKPPGRRVTITRFFSKTLHI